MNSILAFIRTMLNKIIAFFSRKKATEEPETGKIEIIEGPGHEVVCYYGCPNSKKAKKLQLDKKAYR